MGERCADVQSRAAGSGQCAFATTTRQLSPAHGEHMYNIQQHEHEHEHEHGNTMYMSCSCAHVAHRHSHDMQLCMLHGAIGGVVARLGTLCTIQGVLRFSTFYYSIK